MKDLTHLIDARDEYFQDNFEDGWEPFENNIAIQL